MRPMIDHDESYNYVVEFMREAYLPHRLKHANIVKFIKYVNPISVIIFIFFILIIFLLLIFSLSKNYSVQKMASPGQQHYAEANILSN